MKCQNCNQREATEKWVGDGGPLAAYHGCVADWCEVCMVEAQLEHAKERAAEIPKLEQRLTELLA